MVDLDGPQINDLIIYEDNDSRFLARITGRLLDSVFYNWTIDDVAIIRDSSLYDENKAEHTLQLEYKIGTNDIIKDFGNITTDEMMEKYPEWLI